MCGLCVWYQLWCGVWPVYYVMCVPAVSGIMSGYIVLGA